jgi:hypothetical protein
MPTKVLFILSILTYCLILLTGCSHSKKWGTLKSPNELHHIVLYQKDRSMHRTPEIQIRYQKDNMEYYLDSILLPEDDRNTLTYEYQWQSDHKVLLSIHCDFCMIDKRVYTIEFPNNQKPLLRKERAI